MHNFLFIPFSDTYFDCYLLDNGKLLAIIWADYPKIQYGGYGSKIQLINPDSTIDWEYIISDVNRISYHDVEFLPNGNLLVLVWEKRTAEEAKEAEFQENFPTTWKAFMKSIHQLIKRYGNGTHGIIGNPEAYGSNLSSRLFYNNHYPNIVNSEGEIKMLLFMDSNNVEQSVEFEFKIPSSFSLAKDSENELQIEWQFTRENLYSRKLSGAELLPNDNILITIGTYGTWEVNRRGNVV